MNPTFFCRWFIFIYGVIIIIGAHSFNILSEHGYDEALQGLRLSHKNKNCDIEKVAKCLSSQDLGHNKFLESIMVWIEAELPRYIWQEFDTYRVGITKQSESTIHNILKDNIAIDDFDINFLLENIPNHYTIVLKNIIESFIIFTEMVKGSKDLSIIEKKMLIKTLLPESFLQKRIICVNYKTLRNIIIQRKDHQLIQWNFICEKIINGVQHPELLPIL